MRPGAVHPSRGFTLIEIVVTLVIVAVMGTMIYTYLGKAFSESAMPVLQLQKYTDLHRTMENIRAAYHGNPKWRSGTAYVAGNVVVPANPNGHYYTCKAGGACGSSAPDLDGGVNWTDSGRVNLATLQTSIGAEGTNQDNAYFGKYYVVNNKFIQFDLITGIEKDGGSSILKVTIRNNNADTSKYKLGGTLEAMFYISY